MLVYDAGVKRIAWNWQCQKGRLAIQRELGDERCALCSQRCEVGFVHGAARQGLREAADLRRRRARLASKLQGGAQCPVSPVSSIRASDSDRSNSTQRWREVAWQLAGSKARGEAWRADLNKISRGGNLNSREG